MHVNLAISDAAEIEQDKERSTQSVIIIKHMFRSYNIIPNIRQNAINLNLELNIQFN